MTTETGSLLFPVWTETTVRWGDMDAYGHVNNATFFTYFESARMNYFAALDLSRFMKKERFGPVVASATCNFRRQVHYPAQLITGVRVEEVRNRSFIFECVVLRLDPDGHAEIVADGTTAIVWIERATGKAVNLPPALRKAIAALEAQRSGPLPPAGEEI